MDEFKIMAMREGDPVTVTGYHGQHTGTVAWWHRGASYGGSWTVGVLVDGEVQAFEYGGNRPHGFWH